MAVCGSPYLDDEKKMEGKPNIDVIFCGNPGVGKSTLLSCISGVQFESGISFISGKTKELRFQTTAKMPGFRFADTPGLSDVMTCVEAGKHITKAFENAQESGRYVMIVFVLVPLRGRIRPEDLCTIRNVMDAVTIEERKDEKDNLYNIVMNQCDFMKVERLKEEGMQQFRAYFCSESPAVPYTTSLMHFIPIIEKLDGAENTTQEMPELTKFLMRCSMGKIKKVNEIKVDNLQEQLDDMKEAQKETEKQVADLLEDNDRLQQIVEDLNKKHEERMKDMDISLSDVLKGLGKALWRPVEKTLKRSLIKPVDRAVVRPVTKHVIKPAGKHVVKPVDKHVVRPVAKVFKKIF